MRGMTPRIVLSLRDTCWPDKSLHPSYGGQCSACDDGAVQDIIASIPIVTTKSINPHSLSPLLVLKAFEHVERPCAGHIHDQRATADSQVSPFIIWWAMLGPTTTVYDADHIMTRNAQNQLHLIRWRYMASARQCVCRAHHRLSRPLLPVRDASSDARVRNQVRFRACGVFFVSFQVLTSQLFKSSFLQYDENQFVSWFGNVLLLSVEVAVSI